MDPTASRSPWSLCPALQAWTSGSTCSHLSNATWHPWRRRLCWAGPCLLARALARGMVGAGVVTALLCHPHGRALPLPPGYGEWTSATDVCIGQALQALGARCTSWPLVLPGGKAPSSEPHPLRVPSPECLSGLRLSLFFQTHFQSHVSGPSSAPHGSPWIFLASTEWI